MNLIKVFNPKQAKALADLGFEYIHDSINNEQVCAFFASEELIEYLNNNFDAKDYVINNMLHF